MVVARSNIVVTVFSMKFYDDYMLMVNVVTMVTTLRMNCVTWLAPLMPGLTGLFWRDDE